MKAIMISIKPKWCAKIMNGEKTIEVRKNKALAKAIQKLINEYEFADIYACCSKINKKHYHLIESIDTDTGITEYEIDYYCSSGDYLDYCYEGKVAFKFRCYKVEEIRFGTTLYLDLGFFTGELYDFDLYKQSCLTKQEIRNYLKDIYSGYAIHISDLEIFDKPKELSEFYTVGHYEDLDDCFTDEKQINGKWCIPLKKAPQNMVYIEIKNSTHI